MKGCRCMSEKEDVQSEQESDGPIYDFVPVKNAE